MMNARMVPDFSSEDHGYREILDRPVHICDICGDGIYDGDSYYYIDGMNVCCDCIDDYIQEYKKTACTPEEDF